MKTISSWAVACGIFLSAFAHAGVIETQDSENPLTSRAPTWTIAKYTIAVESNAANVYFTAKNSKTGQLEMIKVGMPTYADASAIANDGMKRSVKITCTSISKLEFSSIKSCIALALVSNGNEN